VHDDGTPIGLSEEDMAQSLETLRQMCATVDATMSVRSVTKGIEGTVAEVVVRRKEQGVFCADDMRIAVVGDLDVGKSTLVGVLAKGTLDNGRGLARMQVFRYNHEIEDGRTSSISTHLLYFDHQGGVLNTSNCMQPLTPQDLMREAKRVITFIDLAGDEKYLKTTVTGMLGRDPEHCMLVIAADRGLQPMTAEHLGIQLAFNLPLFCVVSKIDLVSSAQLEAALETLRHLVESAGRELQVVENSEDVDQMLAAPRYYDHFVPVFLVSNITGDGLALLRHFLFVLPPRRQWDKARAQPAEVQLQDAFVIDGVGVVLAGTVRAGQLSVGDTAWCGPASRGNFEQVTIKSVHVNRVPVHTAVAGQNATFAVSNDADESVIHTLRKRKGMFLLESSQTPQACLEFEADVVVLHHPNRIACNYSPVVHAGCIRQAARLISLEKEELKAGDSARCRFQFLYQPEYLVPRTPVLFRDGRTRAVGTVVSIEPIQSAPSSPGPSVCG
jgi:GTPase